MMNNRTGHLLVCLLFLFLVIWSGSSPTISAQDDPSPDVTANPRLGLEQLFPADRPLPPGIAEYLEPEDPPALFDLSVDDMRVDLLLFGTWKSQLAQGFGVRWTPTDRGTIVTTGPMPGLETIPFTNTVDLLLSLWIDAQFFVEINFRDQFEDNRFMVGFSALDPEFWLQKLWAGTHGIGVAAGPLLPSLAIRDGSPGIVSSFRSSVGTHDVFMRIETRDPQVRTFLGTREIVENSVNAGAPVRGRYFLLPYRIPVAATSSVRVWVQGEDNDPGAVSWTSTDGTDTRDAYFRPLNPGSDYLFSGPSGFLALSAASRGMVLVELPGSVVAGDPGAEHLPFLALKSGSVGQLDGSVEVEWGSGGFTTLMTGLDSLENPGNTLGVPLGDERIEFSDSGSRNGILLYDPGRFSPFEVLGYYPAPSGTGGSTDSETAPPLVPGLYQPGPAASGALGSEVGYRSLDLLTQIRDGNLRVFPLQGSTAWAQRWPLEAVVPGGSFEYFSSPETRGSLLIPQFLTPENSESSGAISLGKDFNPGSLSVTRTLRNQQTEARFRYDEETGELFLTPPPGTNEIIRVSYSGNNPLGLDTAFTAGTQHQFKLVETETYTSTLDLGISGSIPFSVQETWQDPTTASSPASPMYTEGIVQFALDGPAGWFKAQAQGRIQRPNSYDARHYLGVGSSFQSLLLDANRVGLGGVPREATLEGVNATAFTTTTLTAANRAPILWANSYPSSVADPLPLTSTNSILPSAKATDLAGTTTTGIIEAGPYPVLATSGTGPQFSGIGYRADVVFEGTGSGATNESWAAFQIPIPLLQSGIPQEISLRWGATAGSDSLPADPSEVHFFLQIGRLDEDTNGNNRTDGTSTSRPSGPTGRGRTQTSGKNWLEEFQLGFAPDAPTEDLNRDGSLTTQESAPIQTFYLGEITSGTQDFRKPLSPEVARYISEVAGSAGNVNWNYSGAQIRIVAVAQTPPSTDGATLALSAVFGDLRLIYPRAGALPGDSGADITTTSGTALVPPASLDPPAYFTEVPGGNAGRSGGYTIEWPATTATTIGDSLWTLGISTPDLPDYQGFGVLFYKNSPDYDLRLTPLNITGELNLPIEGLSAGWYLLEASLDDRTWTLYQAQGTNPKGIKVDEGSHTLPTTTQGLSIQALHTTIAETPTGVFHLHQVTALDPRTQATARFVAEGRLETNEGFTTPGGFTVLGAPWAEGRITGQISSSPSLGTLEGSAGFVLLGIRTETFGDFRLDKGPELTRAGHGLGLAGVIPWVSYQDRFSWVPQRSGSTAAGGAESTMDLSLGPGNPWSLSFEAGVDRGSGGLSRSIQSVADLSLGPQGVYQTSTTLTHSQTALPRDYPFTNEYLGDWVGGYELLDFLPRSIADGRSYGIGTSHSIAPNSSFRTSLGWKAEGSQALGNESPWVLGGNQEVTLNFGAGTDLSWDLEYGRRGSARSGGSDFRSLKSDVALLVDRAGLLPEALVSVPLWDLVSPWSKADFLSELPNEFLSYVSEPRFSVTFRRRISGSIQDLYVPSFGFFETARKTDTGNDAPPDQRSWAASLGLTPINMFGAQGLIPKTEAFSSDEYTLDIGWKTLAFGQSLDPIHGVSLGLGARFYGLGRSDEVLNQVQVPGLGSEYLPYTLSLAQSLDLAIADSYGLGASLSAGFPWTSPLPPTPETFLPLTQNEEWQLVHQESLKFRVLGAWGDRILGSDPSSLEWFSENAKFPENGFLGSADFDPWSPTNPRTSLNLTHETILTLPYTGYLRGFVDLGWTGTSSTLGLEKWTHSIGGRIGLEILLEL